ncbi:MAG: hypothetical protein Q8781_00930 [Candidatus Phytoplasma stylosanthis]|uniref:hypothetical protein n=1 Tax=Candidatus Phytoplasma stylosanthis TaxID=2798314 RepID=UPI0029398C8F|nr:hypothetical protein [Candidatus Phytoplasma stylosanthis]MDV3167871.1 hypothetical protein [Candidatus Phytoplasma stylosanthis]MDV3170853.1 hypothetical protein [Candidatus Phytoplasma stylosanthis]MDV3173521.1 hypothetical protein [Candidatus Phytoplasma stylosanthis]MDV3174033.1 hypothetical protein [Candidatus Phytoplasma stylosanthis]MDV3202455.1 hypothetical protein [Candidatus Phytoplasma stylosanthis]
MMEQENLLEKFKKIIKNKKLSHFYIIEHDEDIEEQKSFMFELVYEFFKKDESFIEENIILKNLINKFSYPNFYYLDAKNKKITKEDILEMKLYLNHTSLIEKKKIFIINCIENVSYKITNSLLSFLENPVSKHHLGILFTCDCNLLLPTILSRGQVFSLKSNSKFLSINDSSKKLSEDELDKVLFFLLKIFKKEQISDYYFSLKEFFLSFLDNIFEKKIISQIFFNSFYLNKIKFFIDDFLLIGTSFFLDLYFYKNNLNVIFPKSFLSKKKYNKLSLKQNLKILNLLIEIEQRKNILDSKFCFMFLFIQIEKELQIKKTDLDMIC